MRSLIVDDERLARNDLKQLLTRFNEIEIIGEAANADEAEKMIEQEKPDLIFLDIQMPGRSGFELLESLVFTPLVIFTTAYDAYALKAFEVNALDYLLKPIEPARLKEALSRVAEEMVPPVPKKELLTAEDRVYVKDGSRSWFIRLADVWLFESVGNYTRLYFEGGKPLVNRTLSYLEERLNRDVFFRANRQHMINLKYVQTLREKPGGSLSVQIEGGTVVEMSRRRAQQFRDTMKL